MTGVMSEPGLVLVTCPQLVCILYKTFLVKSCATLGNSVNLSVLVMT